MRDEVWNILEETLVKGEPGDFVLFWTRLPEKGSLFFLDGGYDLHRNCYGSNFIISPL